MYISFNYITSFIDGFIFSDSVLIVLTFLIVFSANYYYYEEIVYNNEEAGEERDNRMNYDFFFRFVQLSVDELWFFYSFLITELKRYIFFNQKFKYYFSNRTKKIFFEKKIKNKFLLWRPIFKKWSYLGYYRANRSKWIK